MKRYIVINGLKYETLAVIKARVAIMLLILTMCLYALFQIQTLTKHEIILVVGIMLFSITRLVGSFDKYDESALATSVLTMTVSDFKLAYRGLRTSNHSSRNYFVKIYMEKMILDACGYMGINEAGLTRGYVGKIKTSKHFLLGNCSFLYQDVRMQFLVDKFFENNSKDEILFKNLSLS